VISTDLLISSDACSHGLGRMGSEVELGETSAVMQVSKPIVDAIAHGILGELVSYISPWPISPLLAHGDDLSMTVESMFIGIDGGARRETASALSDMGILWTISLGRRFQTLRTLLSGMGRVPVM